MNPFKGIGLFPSLQDFSGLISGTVSFTEKTQDPRVGHFEVSVKKKFGFQYLYGRVWVTLLTEEPCF